MYGNPENRVLKEDEEICGEESDSVNKKVPREQVPYSEIDK
jgi:hypothetical protein